MHSIVVQLIDKLVHPVLREIVRVKSEDFSLQNNITEFSQQLTISSQATVDDYTHCIVQCALHNIVVLYMHA